MLNNLTIKARLILVVGLMSVLAITLGIIGLNGMKKSNEGLRSVYEDRTITMGQLAIVDSNLIENRLAMVNSLVFKNEVQENVNLVKKNIQEIDKEWDAYMATKLTPEEKRLAEKFAIDRERFVVEGLNTTMEYLLAGDAEAAEKNIRDVVRPLFVPVMEGIDALQQLQSDVAVNGQQN
ncbi:MAG: Tar ligand binding domain-containing protein [Methylobacter sp.]|nr:Tar ligand binding domain-containing protein [Methylobacter sp.]